EADNHRPDREVRPRAWLRWRYAMNRLLPIVVLVFVLAAAGSSRHESLHAQGTAAAATDASSGDQALVDKYCVTCHNARSLSGNLSLAGLDVTNPADHPETFEKVIRKVRAGLMPPAG